MPPNTKPPSELGAIFFFHGFTGSALETVSDEGLVEIARKQGVALVALEGLGGRRFLPGVAEPKRDEIEYLLGFLEAPMLSKRGLTF
jgi:polyhydroxybutyrate depolymerase